MYMKKIFIFILIIPVFCHAQFTDDFSNGNFTHNPSWSGDVSHFSVENYQLRLTSPSQGPFPDSSYLVTESSIVEQTEWRFFVRLAFTPSDNNHAVIYLASDNADLRGPLNGYYIQIGKTGTDNKRLYLFRQDGTQKTQLIEGLDNLATGSNNLLRIRVTRDGNGLWEMFCDPLGGHAFFPQGSAIDQTYNATAFFGVLCKYTTTNVNRFYFDDFYVGQIIPDTIPPQIEMVNVLSDNSLELVFNKALEPTTALDLSNYEVDMGVGQPAQASFVAGSFNVVELSFTGSFTQTLPYIITARNIMDLSGNTMQTQSKQFVYYIPVLHDVVFNELMVDPTPAVGLPPHEYIELYNRTPYPINLRDWHLQHAQTVRIIPDAVIEPEGYVLLVTENAYPELAAYGNVVAVPGLSATALTNAGTTLVLSDAQNNIIHALAYTDDWYDDNQKRNGGWSLEMIDAANPCGGMANWRASEDPTGGTPGYENSIIADNPDTLKPSVLRVGIIDSVTVEVFFDQRMLPHSLDIPQYYSIDNGIGQPLSLMPQSPLFKSVILELPVELQTGTIYKITVSQALEDCVGLQLSDNNTAYFGLPQPAEPNDIVINEILFNPPVGGTEYVEIYNRSSKIIDLQTLRLSSKDTILDELTQIRNISASSYLMFPEDYIVLTSNNHRVKPFYHTPYPQNFVEMPSLPQFNNSSGIAVIANAAAEEIDMLVYEEGMHYPLLRDVKGVSLERIHYERPSDDRTNWHSAAAGAGYGTPGYKNSQFGIVLEADDVAITVYPKVFSPDNDGHDDVLNIAYKFENPGYVASIVIYDARGRQVRHLVNNELLGTSGMFSWNGITDDNLKANIGIYIIFVEVFDVNGQVKKYKKTAVLAGKLNR